MRIGAFLSRIHEEAAALGLLLADDDTASAVAGLCALCLMLFVAFAVIWASLFRG